MRQYNKEKPNKWGFKVFALCNSKTGTIHNFEMYTGKEPVETKRTGDLSTINTNILESINDSTLNPSFF